MLAARPYANKQNEDNVNQRARLMLRVTGNDSSKDLIALIAQKCTSNKDYLLKYTHDSFIVVLP